MKNLKKSWISSLLCVSILGACAPKGPEAVQRAPIGDLSAINSSASNLVSPLTSAIESETYKSACERLEFLSKQKNLNGASYFSYLGELRLEEKKKSRNYHGALRIEDSVLAKYVLGESFQVSDEETFYEAARKEHEAGNLSGLKWFVVKLGKFFGFLRSLQYSATNDKLAETFPGMYGEEMPLEGALHFSLAKKVAKLEALSQEQLQVALLKRIPLFSADGSWSTWAEESRDNLSAAMGALKAEAPQAKDANGLAQFEKEKLCGLVLMHQSFSQLMSLRGYKSPTMQQMKNGKQALVELSSDQPEFPKKDHHGAFFDTAARKSVVLTNDGIQSYDPSAKFMPLTRITPNGAEQTEAGSMSDGLAAMEALLYAFEATSPASPWVKREEEYRFGDITDSSNKAILPAEAHALSLGLLTIQFKNLGALYIKQVNNKGMSLQEGESVAGIAIASEQNGSLIRTKIIDVIRLAQVVAYLENSMKRFLQESPAVWKKRNAVYSEKTLAALFGLAIFSQEELDKLLSKPEQENILRNKLLQLKLPLALLLSQMSDANAACLSEIEWDLATGARTALGRCSVEEKEKYAAIFSVLAKDTGSALLMRKAEKIRQN